MAVVFALLLISSAAASTCDLITRYGYPCQDYITPPTDDGWLLLLERIPHGKTNATSKGVVYFQHGLLDSSAGISLLPPSQGLPFILADLGYDVWLGNVRGNGQSLNMHYTSDKPQFWNFSYDELGTIDIPTMINFILNTTGQKQLSYIGHSQGTISALIAVSEFPELSKKLKGLVLLAPIAFMGHCRSLLMDLLVTFNLDTLVALLGVQQFALPKLLALLVPGTCQVTLEILCRVVLEQIFGPSDHFNYNDIPKLLPWFPAPTSVKNMVHWAQGIRSNKFQKFDYGSPSANAAAYGTVTPPQYDLMRISPTLPMALYAGSNDYLADPDDVLHLVSALPPSINRTSSVIAGYAHADFILSPDANKLLFPSIISTLAAWNR